MTDFDPDDEEPSTGSSEPNQRDTKQHGFRLGLGIDPLTDLLRIEGSTDSAPPVEESTDHKVPVDEGSSETTTDDYLVSVDRRENEVIVTADLPGVSKDEINIGIGEKTNNLVIQVKGATIKRISLPWEMVVATNVTFNNFILEVRLSPAFDDSSDS